MPAQTEQKTGKPYKIRGVWYYPKADPTYKQTGIASWYGPGFHGRRTANGEIFDQNALTAAHTTLPLPSVVRVTNLDNGRSVELRVNDRGPFIAGRIIDVSRRAAQLLGFERAGTARVRVENLEAGSRSIKRRSPDQRGSSLRHALSSRNEEPVGIYIQVAAPSDARNAELLREQVETIAESVVMCVTMGDQDLYKVLLGPLDSIEVSSALAQARGAGFPDAYVLVN